MIVSEELGKSVKTSWHAFLETYEPLRADLYRYCRHLTRSPWDAEDLAQDALARGFVTLAQMGAPPPNPRAWLFRVASNLWIDRVRRGRRETLFGADVPSGVDIANDTSSDDPRALREAAGTLLGQLSPQERVAVVLKDAFDFSLEEAAETLATSVGAIKTALHRARTKLVEPQPEPVEPPAPAALNAFVSAFNAGDIESLAALLLESASVEVVGATTEYGPEAARKTVLFGMLFGVKFMVNPSLHPGLDARCFQGVVERAPRVEARFHHGAWVLVHWYAHDDGEAVRALTLLDLEGERVTRLRNYFYTTAALADVCRELGLPARSNGFRWWRLGA